MKYARHLLGILLCICLLLTMTLPVAAEDYADAPVATPADPYTFRMEVPSGVTEDTTVSITSARDLVEFADRINNSTNTSAVWYVTVDTNEPLDLDAALNEGETWSGIGTNAVPFRGIFDGLCENEAGGIEPVRIILPAGATTSLFVEASGTGNIDTMIRGVQVQGDITYTGDYAGGIVNTLWGGAEVLECRYSGTLRSAREEMGVAGGIAGLVREAYVTECYMEAHTAEADGNLVQNSVNGNVAGGIVGEVKTSANITCCGNEAPVAGLLMAGGIAGATEGGAFLEYCFNTGRVEATGFSASDETPVAGGLVASASSGSYGYVSSYYSFNGGAVTGDVAGGLVGICQDGVIKNCFNVGTITGDTYAGGLLGFINLATYPTVADCYNTGSLALSGAAENGVVDPIFGSSSAISYAALGCWYLVEETGENVTNSGAVAVSRSSALSGELPVNWPEDDATDDGLTYDDMNNPVWQIEDWYFTKGMFPRIRYATENPFDDAAIAYTLSYDVTEMTDGQETLVTVHPYIFEGYSIWNDYAERSTWDYVEMDHALTMSWRGFYHQLQLPEGAAISTATRETSYELDDLPATFTLRKRVVTPGEVNPETGSVISEEGVTETTEEFILSPNELTSEPIVVSAVYGEETLFRLDGPEYLQTYEDNFQSAGNRFGWAIRFDSRQDEYQSDAPWFIPMGEQHLLPDTYEQAVTVPVMDGMIRLGEIQFTYEIPKYSAGDVVSRFQMYMEDDASGGEEAPDGKPVETVYTAKPQAVKVLWDDMGERAYTGALEHAYYETTEDGSYRLTTPAQSGCVSTGGAPLFPGNYVVVTRVAGDSLYAASTSNDAIPEGSTWKDMEPGYLGAEYPTLSFSIRRPGTDLSDRLTDSPDGKLELDVIPGGVFITLPEGGGYSGIVIDEQPGITYVCGMIAWFLEGVYHLTAI